MIDTSIKNTKIYYFYIYMHINNINNKVYIGQTRQKNLNMRWKNGIAYKTSTYFNSAIEKYGWKNFSHIVLEEGKITMCCRGQRNTSGGYHWRYQNG